MSYVVSREQMYELDNRTITEFGVSSSKLMEIAGYTSVLKMDPYFKEKGYSRIAILSGHGNNGGDGLVIARWLARYGYDVNIYFYGDESKMTAETEANYLLTKKAEIEVKELNLDNVRKFNHYRYDVIIDCLLGIGYKGALKSPLNKIITMINEIDAYKVAIDIPSGLNANTGICKLAFCADKTYTMGAIKQGMFLNDGATYCGEIDVVDIGIPHSYYNESIGKFGTLKQELELPPRKRNSHKGDYGRVTIIAGSEGYTGAAILSSKACVRIGAGLVTLLHEPGLNYILETSLVEVMTKSYDTSKFYSMLQQSNIVLVGPGLGLIPKSAELVRYILLNFSGKVIMDADAITLVSREMELLEKTKAEVLLTPHLGEFASLCHKSVDKIKDKIFNEAEKLVEKYGVTILVKSANSFVLSKEGLVFNNRGNDGLSTGGSGDVLAGLITGMVAQGFPLFKAASNSSFYLGRLAEKLSKERKTYSIIPSDLIENIGKL
jgi:NAD(P)H-hydrate epimerase